MRKLFILLALPILLTTACKKENPDDPKNDPVAAIVLDCSTISENMTLSNNPDAPVDYIVPCKINIDGNVTVEPGTVIQFESDAGFQINNGSLKSIGTAAAPIVMEGVDKVAGAWRGLIFFSNNVNNILEYTTVRHAGGNSFNSNNDRGNVIVYANAKLSLRNSVISDGAEYGLNLSYASAQITFANNTINDCGKAPLIVPAGQAHKLDAASTFAGNARQYLEIGTDYVEEAVTWTKTTLPYRIVSYTAGDQVWVRNNGKLTLSAGIDIEFEANLGIRVSENSSITAIGTATEPVILTGASAAPGAWKGMIVYSDDVNNQFDHVQMSYAGSSAFNSNGDKGTIILWADSRFAITNSTLRDGDGSCGINVTSASAVLTESGNTFTNVGTPICQ